MQAVNIRIKLLFGRIEGIADRHHNVRMRMIFRRAAIDYEFIVRDFDIDRDAEQVAFVMVLVVLFDGYPKIGNV